MQWQNYTTTISWLKIHWQHVSYFENFILNLSFRLNGTPAVYTRFQLLVLAKILDQEYRDLEATDCMEQTKFHHDLIHLCNDIIMQMIPFASLYIIYPMTSLWKWLNLYHLCYHTNSIKWCELQKCFNDILLDLM